MKEAGGGVLEKQKGEQGEQNDERRRAARRGRTKRMLKKSRVHGKGRGDAIDSDSNLSIYLSYLLRLSTSVCLLNLTPGVHWPMVLSAYWPMVLSAYDGGDITISHRCSGEVV